MPKTGPGGWVDYHSREALRCDEVDWPIVQWLLREDYDLCLARRCGLPAVREAVPRAATAG